MCDHDFGPDELALARDLLQHERACVEDELQVERLDVGARVAPARLDLLGGPDLLAEARIAASEACEDVAPLGTASRSVANAKTASPSSLDSVNGGTSPPTIPCRRRVRIAYASGTAPSANASSRCAKATDWRNAVYPLMSARTSGPLAAVGAPELVLASRVTIERYYESSIAKEASEHELGANRSAGSSRVRDRRREPPR